MAFLKRHIYKLVYGGTFVMAFALALATTIRYLVRVAGDVQMPSIVGKDLVDATSELSRHQLKVVVLGKQFNDEVTQDRVMYQDVVAGEWIRRGRSIGVFLSLGPREQNIPNVEGLSWAVALRMFESSRTTYHVVAHACKDGTEKDQVVAQDNEREPNVILSTGNCSDRFILSKVEGLPLGFVVSQFKKSGISIQNYSFVPRSDIEPRLVVDIIPAVGSVVHPFDSLSLVVSTEPEKPTEIATQGSWQLLTILNPSRLTKNQAKLWVDRGDPSISYAIDFLLLPGENASEVVWVSRGTRIEYWVEEREIWRKEFE